MISSPDPGSSQKITPIHSIPKFCSQCGKPLVKKFVEEELRERLVCSVCGTIQYVNPYIVAGVIPEKEGKIVLLERGIEPGKGLWTYPAGFVELWETVPHGAQRETLEEIGIHVSIEKLLGLYSYEEVGVAIVVYEGKVLGGTLTPSREATSVREFLPEDIPWDNLAFRSTQDALKDWVAKRT